MDKRMRTNVILAAVVIVLGLVIWLAPESEKADPGVSMFGSGEKISRIEILENGATRVRLEERAGEWWLVEPLGIAADEFQVDALLGTLLQNAERRYAVSEADLEQLGLAEPEWQLVVNGQEIMIGGRSAIGSNRYVQKGDYVYLVDDALSYRLQRDPLDYASKALLNRAAQMRAVELPAGQRIENVDDRWQLVPENDAVSADAIRQLVAAWQNATALKIAAAPVIPPGEQIRLEFADAEPVVFTVMMEDDALALYRDQPQLKYELPRDDARRLLQLEVEKQTLGTDNGEDTQAETN